MNPIKPIINQLKKIFTPKKKGETMDATSVKQSVVHQDNLKNVFVDEETNREEKNRMNKILRLAKQAKKKKLICQKG